MKSILKSIFWGSITIVILVSVFLLASDSKMVWVRGEYGKRCYEKGEEHKNIKYPVLFETLEDCLESIK